MKTNDTFYLCPVCFEVTMSDPGAHRHRMVHVNPSLLSEERRRPVTDGTGQLRSRAPIWFLEAAHGQTR